MNIEQSVIEKLKVLPLKKQQEVLDFIDFVHQKCRPKQARRKVKGLWQDLNIQITEKDISEARREVWGDFTREDFG